MYLLRVGTSSVEHPQPAEALGQSFSNKNTVRGRIIDGNIRERWRNKRTLEVWLVVEYQIAKSESPELAQLRDRIVTAFWVVTGTKDQRPKVRKGGEDREGHWGMYVWVNASDSRCENRTNVEIEAE